MIMANRSIRRALLGMFLGVVAAVPAWAQSSASYKLQEATVNGGGDPASGVALASAHFRISLDAIGEGAVRVGLVSASFHLDGSFLGRYAPPGEVSGTRFSDATTLQWNAEPSAGVYEVYRGTSLPGTYGTCFASNLTATNVTDATIPSVGGSFFYLVTARNRLSEEGTKGFSSNGTQRPNSLPCP